MNLELKLINLIESDYLLCSILKKAEELHLNDCWVAAGIIRNKVWDNLHTIQTDINDIDVIYFDDSDISLQREKALESKLNLLLPNQPWSVKNQARMHIKNGVDPYLSSYDGVAHFPETPTSIAIRIKNNEIEIIAPYGLQDLFEGRVRPTPPYQKGSKLHPIYLERIQNKKWNTIWSNLVIESQ
ncbi:hypothetical protein DCE79_05620 [Lysinibacillus sp. 2017]|uniref:nucleotidyltransferase family protein n=1 Tax=unclassified Lysinibacillus TaxID=2636778 RepID=UPI000D5286C5|nr:MULTISPECIES: nucleotidyltransferase family protein [unclassified Lysinibacillus]AWE06907.1 hypothetical protein DCE79_05620 [Lysinibacillus sp. 2017]TGN37164.1 nucleotidyltransferase family protein [Lysinibacillus sp. S2017]